MKTINWQTKVLALFIAVAALWLATACGNGDANNESLPTPAMTATPTQTPAVATFEQQVGCTHETPETRSWLNTTEEEYVDSLPGHYWLPGSVLNKYEDLFWRQPNVYDVTIGQLRDGDGRWTETWAIIVWVTEKVDQSTLPPEDRIPESLHDVQIQILDTEPPPKVPESNCDYSKCGLNLEKGDTNTLEERARRQARGLKVRDKYEPLFMRQPNAYSTGFGRFTDENGELTGESGIIVRVSKKVDQSTLPPEDRIPDCLEGIPVQIREEQPSPINTGSIQKATVMKVKRNEKRSTESGRARASHA